MLDFTKFDILGMFELEDHARDCDIDLLRIGDINEVSFAMENAILMMCKTGDFSSLNKLLTIAPVNQKL